MVVAKLSFLAVPKMEWPIPVPGHASITMSAGNRSSKARCRQHRLQRPIGHRVLALPREACGVVHRTARFPAVCRDAHDGAPASVVGQQRGVWAWIVIELRLRARAVAQRSRAAILGGRAARPARRRVLGKVGPRLAEARLRLPPVGGVKASRRLLGSKKLVAFLRQKVVERVGTGEDPVRVGVERTAHEYRTIDSRGSKSDLARLVSTSWSAFQLLRFATTTRHIGRNERLTRWSVSGVRLFLASASFETRWVENSRHSPLISRHAKATPCSTSPSSL